MSIDFSGPIELEPGYFELRVNWDARDLMAMSGAELDRFKGAINALEQIAREFAGVQVG